MSRRTIMALAASVIFGIGFIASLFLLKRLHIVARWCLPRRPVYRGGDYRGGYYRGVRPGVAGGSVLRVGAAVVGAAAAGCLLRTRLLRRSCSGRLSIRLLLLRPLQPLCTRAIVDAMWPN